MIAIGRQPYPVPAGAGTGTYNPAGIINFQNNVGGVGNAADLTDDTLFTYTLPAGSLNANGKSVRVRAALSTAANANNKNAKLWFGGTAVMSSGVITANAKNATIEVEVTRISATTVTTVGTFTSDGSAPVVTTGTTVTVANLDSNTTIIKATGASPTTGAASDMNAYSFKVSFEG